MVGQVVSSLGHDRTNELDPRRRFKKRDWYEQPHEIDCKLSKHFS